jgi:hypothetical protein
MENQAKNFDFERATVVSEKSSESVHYDSCYPLHWGKQHRRVIKIQSIGVWVDAGLSGAFSDR